MRKYIKYNDIEVVYRENLHGGGIRFGQQYIPVVKEKFGHVEHVFEFCAGPGFIGFSLLANNLCDKLTLADINPEAVKVCNETIIKNNLESTVTTYLSDCLDNVPETEKWDLVVGNPPHVFTESEEEYKKDITLYNPQFNIHKKFYRDIRKFLKPTGSITPPRAPVLTKIGFNLPTIQKAMNPIKVYKFLKRKIFPPTPRNYYFIHAKPA